jgi:hypothetical protein
MIGTLHFLEKVLTIAWKLAKVGHEILWNTMEKNCWMHPPPSAYVLLHENA